MMANDDSPWVAETPEKHFGWLDSASGDTAAHRRRIRREKLRRRRQFAKSSESSPTGVVAFGAGDWDGGDADGGTDGGAEIALDKSDDLLDKVLARVDPQSEQRAAPDNAPANAPSNDAVVASEETVVGANAICVSSVAEGDEAGAIAGSRLETLRAAAASAAQERKHARVIRNREVALKARQAFKARLQSLETENFTLKEKASSLHAENDALRSQILAIRASFRSQETLQTSAMR